MQETVGEETRPLLQAKGMTKSFSGNTVLSQVDLTLLPGEVHAIVGENGAGKSTLIKLLGGVHIPDSGQLMVRGEEVSFHSPRHAIRKGLAVIHQEFSLTPHLSAEENIFLGHFPTTPFGSVDRKKIREETTKLLDRLSVSVNPSVPISQLSIAQQQMVEIAKALSLDAEILILDEPTAVLDEDNVASLFAMLNRLREEGLGIIYISHHLEEIFEIADKVTVLRDGVKTGQSSVTEVDHDWLVRHMIGREFPTHESVSKSYGDIALAVEDLTVEGLFEGISFEARAGEIVGLAGLVGAGRSEVAQTIFGIRKPDRGTIRIFGKERKIRSTRDAIRLGIGYVTEDRKTQGLFLNRPVIENLTMSSLKKFFTGIRLRLNQERKYGRELVDRLDIRLSSLQSPVMRLSGGNQQKVLIGRSLAVEPKILLLDEPTRGVDIGAKQEIYTFIQNMINRGMAIVLISSELEEIIRMADRVMVLRKGRIVNELTRDEATEEAIMKSAALATTSE